MDRNFFVGVGVGDPHVVALRKESVDRNAVAKCVSRMISCRSPQGERG